MQFTCCSLERWSNSLLFVIEGEQVGKFNDMKTLKSAITKTVLITVFAAFVHPSIPARGGNAELDNRHQLKHWVEKLESCCISAGRLVSRRSRGAHALLILLWALVAPSGVHASWNPPEVVWHKMDGGPATSGFASQMIDARGNRNYLAEVIVRPIVPATDGSEAGFSLKVEQFYRDASTPDLPHFLSQPEGVVALDGGRVLLQNSFHIRHRLNAAWVEDLNTARRFQLVVEGNAPFAIESTKLSMTSPFENRPLVLKPYYEPVPALTAGVVEAQNDRPEARWSLRSIDGRTRLLKNEESVIPVIYGANTVAGPPSNPRMVRGQYADFAEAGFPISFLKAYLGDSNISFKPSRMWRGKDDFDFSLLDEGMWRILKVAPEMNVLLYLTVDPYSSWGSENLDEVFTSEAGKKAAGDWHLKRWVDMNDPAEAMLKRNERLLPSLFSVKAREEITEAIRRMIDHIDQQPYRNAIMGIFVVGAHDAQMTHYSQASMQFSVDPEIGDYSPAARNAFRQWLREFYDDDVNALREAWSDDQVTFESAEIPTAKERIKPVASFFPSQMDRRTFDFSRFYSSERSFLADYLCGKIKEFSDGRLITGFYGANPVEHPNADLSAKYNPADGGRIPGYTIDLPLPFSSWTLHGKLLIHEFDVRTIMTPGRFPEDNFNVGKTKTAEDFLSSVLKVSALTAVRGQGIWPMELGPGENWFAHEDLMQGLAWMPKIFEQDLELKGRPKADVALFYDSKFPMFVSDHPTQAFRRYIEWYLGHPWAQTGVPYSFYYQSDITNPKLPEYKVYIFLTPQAISAEEEKRILELKRDGNILVFVHGPGIFQNGNSLENVSRLTGMDVAKLENVRYEGIWAGGDHPLLQELSGPFDHETYSMTISFNRIGTELVLQGSAFAVTDPDAVPLGVYADWNPDDGEKNAADAPGGGQRPVAVAVKEFENWTSIFYGTPRLDSLFLRNIAKFAEVWTTHDSFDAVWANQNFMAVHAMAPGLKTLRLRQPSIVYDLIDSSELTPEPIESFEIPMSFGETRVFLLDEQSTANK